MNVHRFLHSSNSYVPNLLSGECSGFVVAPAGYTFEREARIPIVFDSNEVQKSAFTSAAGYIQATNKPCTKLTIGKNIDGNNTLYLNTRFAFRGRGKEKKLLYLLCHSITTASSYSRHYKLIVSPEFVLDTKTLWLNGLKTHLLPYITHLDIECMNDLSCFVQKAEVPKTADYSKDISEFLRSEEAIEYAKSFFRQY